MSPDKVVAPSVVLSRELLPRAFFICVLLVTLPLCATAGPSPGNEVTEDGVVHVKNPANPAEGVMSMALEERWRLGADEDEDAVIFGVVDDMVVDDEGNVYVLDTQLNEIMIFTRDGEYVRSIGRAGEGPGEFLHSRNLFLTGDGNVAVLQMMPGKIVLLTPEGVAAGNHPVPESDGMVMFSSARPAGDDIILGTREMLRSETGFQSMSSLKRIDRNGEEVALYWQKSRVRDMSRLVFDEKQLGETPTWAVAPDGRVWASDSFDDYAIKVWREDGKLDRVVEREFELRERSKEEMETRGPIIQVQTSAGALKTEVVKSKTDRAILDVVPRDDGTVWVLNSRGAYDVDEGELGTFDVFDGEGQFVRQVALLGKGDYEQDGWFLVGDRLYVVTDQRSARRSAVGAETDEDLGDAEPMMVVCYQFGQAEHTSR